MKVFQCGNCSNPLFFENDFCENCNNIIGYDDEMKLMITYGAVNQNQFASENGKFKFKFCKNKEFQVCNWLVREDSPNDYCTACYLNRTIPNLSNKTNHEKWDKLEIAKHRLIYQLQELGLPLVSKLVNEQEGLCFDFIERDDNLSIMTGHANGVITLLLSEADSVLRE